MQSIAETTEKATMRFYLGKLGFLHDTVYVDIVEVAGSSPVPPTLSKRSQSKGLRETTRDPFVRFLAREIPSKIPFGQRKGKLEAQI